MTEEEFEAQCMADWAAEENAYYENHKRVNGRILKAVKNQFGEAYLQDVEKLFTDMTIGILELVEKPAGKLQEENYQTYIHWIYVQQWTGHECDDYHGNIFVKLKEGKYLKIPYSC